MTQRETAMAALLAVLQAGLPGHSVLRATGTPEPIPNGQALILLHDGSCEAAEPLLSPLRYEIIWNAPITLDAETAAIREGTVEALAALLVADPGLGGAVDWAEIGMPEAEVMSSPSLEGHGQQPPVFSISIPIRLHYVADSPAG
ncbi:hypothetical protein [Sediminicoccus sp. KRV36]|uniref:hypothetical protein n=1 Tax=Sediminicoccus sp. KRV36 TaxID=3133721 RepID=UPI00200BD480|nr:hypothetical protein [Sediminicoccus rosea]UPY37216.1 hypothetical protein LHU95_00550 [Sediminicoccus rosea]